jgi:hypothetical protein
MDTGDATERQERQALGAILRSVSSDMVPALAARDNAKVAWDMLKSMRTAGDNRVREARRQKLRKEFEAMAFKTDKSVEDFSMRMSSLVSELQSLGDRTTELDAIQKTLRVVPARYAQMACSIETLLDLSTLTIEELSGRLSASEGRGTPEQDASGRLLMTEEEWMARQQHRTGGSSQGEKKGKPQGKTKSPGGGTPDRGESGKASHDGGGGKRRKGNCNYCRKPDHWAKECRKAQRDREKKKQETANLVQPSDEHQEGLLMAVVERSYRAPCVVLVINDNPYGLMVALSYMCRTCP